MVSLRLDPKDPRRAGADSPGWRHPVKEDTQAKLALAGITGTSIIQLSGGTPQSPAQGQDGKLPTIIASPSPIARLLNDSNDLMTGVTMLLHNANQMFSPENIERISNTLATWNRPPAPSPTSARPASGIAATGRVASRPAPCWSRPRR
jgi:phospholipid/cholesterol/gamma-HCH transport system substrate-binding protein